MAAPRDRNFYIYVKAFEEALADNVVTLDETNLLQTIIDHFGYDQDTLVAAVDHITGKEKMNWTDDEVESFMTDPDAEGDIELYFKIIMQALDDEKITADEWAIINNFRNLFGLGEEDHEAVETMVNDEIERRKKAMVDRFENYVKGFVGTKES